MYIHLTRMYIHISKKSRTFEVRKIIIQIDMKYQRAKRDQSVKGTLYYNVRIFRNFETKRFAVIAGESYCNTKPQMHAYYSADGKEIDMKLWFKTERGAKQYAEKAESFLKSLQNETKKKESDGNRTKSGCQVYSFRR